MVPIGAAISVANLAWKAINALTSSTPANKANPTGGTAKASTPISSSNSVSVPALQQGYNECGPTSLAMAMDALDPSKNYSKDMFGSSTVGHGPLALKQKAEANGFTVRQVNNGSLEDLARSIDNGSPPLVLGINGGGTNSSLSSYIDNASQAHWMVVTGYERNDAGQISRVYVNDPNSGQRSMSAAEFNTFWHNNIIPGGHNYFMALAKNNTPTATKLPANKTDPIFARTLAAINGLENTFYSGENASQGSIQAAANAYSAGNSALGYLNKNAPSITKKLTAVASQAPAVASEVAALANKTLSLVSKYV